MKENFNINKLAGKYEDFKWKMKRHSFLQITDNNEITIDGCQRIIAYDENVIRLLLTKNKLTVIGDNMRMKNFSTDGVIIEGSFHSIEFIKD